MKKLAFGLFVVFIFAAFVLAAVWPLQPVSAQGQGNCLDPNADGYIKKDLGGTSVTITADEGFVINSITVKAGSDASTDNPCTTFTEDGEYTCYSVSGIGTGSVTVVKIGGGPSCKDISHLEGIEVIAPTETPPTETPPTETPPTVTVTPPTETPPTETPIVTVTPTPEPTTPVPYEPPTGTPESVLPVTGADFGTRSNLPFFGTMILGGIGMLVAALRKK